MHGRQSANSISLVSVDSTAEHGSHVFDVSCRICTGAAAAERTNTTASTTDNVSHSEHGSSRSPRKKIGLAQRLKMYSAERQKSSTSTDVPKAGDGSISETVGNADVGLTAGMADVSGGVDAAVAVLNRRRADLKVGDDRSVLSCGAEPKTDAGDRLSSRSKEALVERKDGGERKLGDGSLSDVPRHEVVAATDDSLTVTSAAEDHSAAAAAASDDDGDDDDDAVWKFPLLQRVGSVQSQTTARWVTASSLPGLWLSIYRARVFEIGPTVLPVGERIKESKSEVNI